MSFQDDEDIYDVQPKNLISVGGIKNMFEPKTMNNPSNNLMPVRKAPPPIQVKPSFNTGKGDSSVPALPEKTVVNKEIDSKKTDSPNVRSSKISKNPFLQMDKASPEPLLKPKPAIKPWKPKPVPPTPGSTVNANTHPTTTSSSDTMSQKVPGIDTPVQNDKSEVKTSPLATESEIQNKLSQLKGLNNESNENNKNTNQAGAANSVIRKTHPTKKALPMKRKSTIKRKSYKRLEDGLKFLEIPLIKLNLGGPPPEKPERVQDFDLTRVINEYNEQLTLLGDGAGYDEDDIYEDIALDISRERAVSLIKPMSEDEEWPEDSEVYDDTGIDIQAASPPERPAPSRLHSTSIIQDHDPEEDYEDLDSATADALYEDGDKLMEGSDNSGGDKKEMDAKSEREVEVQEDQKSITQSNQNINQSSKEEKISEKEKKKREKEEKDRQKKEEKRIRDILKKFKITAADLTKVCPTGTIKSDSKGAKSDLTVTAGQNVKIIRMEKPNPAGRWLIQLVHDESVGYVVSDNVQVETSGIRDVMQTTHGEPQEDRANGVVEDLYEAL
ncbi:hypothetical protein ScPMuIL_006855 [Solemya velum]